MYHMSSKSRLSRIYSALELVSQDSSLSSLESVITALYLHIFRHQSRNVLTFCFHDEPKARAVVQAKEDETTGV